ncbi:MAG: heavy-metal-associated domain-containing protein [Firmicutes bacterium]|nr:heavy-metal-associated domain-containing protein [Bacillota bacterium]
MQEASLQLTSLSCPSCAETIGQVLKRQKGVEDATVTFATSRVKVTYDPSVISLDAIEKAIAKTGYKVISSS